MNGDMGKNLNCGKASVSAGSCFYYLAFTTYSFFHALEIIRLETVFGLEIDTLSTAATVFSILFLLLKLLIERYTAREVASITFLVIVGFAVFYTSGSWICLSIVLFVCASRSVSIKTLMIATIGTTLAVMLIAWVGVVNGAVENVLYPRDGILGLRNPMGFAHPNQYGMMIARLGTAMFVLLAERRSALLPFILLAFSAWAILLPDSRTAAAYLVLLAGLSGLLRMKNLALWDDRRNRFAKSVLVLICFSAAISIAIMIAFQPGNPLMMWLNDILNGRPYSSWYYYNQFGLHAFGSANVVSGGTGIWVGSDHIADTLDNAWVVWGLMYGFVPTIILIIGFIKLYKSAIQGGALSVPLVALAAIAIFYSLSEAVSFSVDFNPLLVLMSSVIYRESFEISRSASHVCLDDPANSSIERNEIVARFYYYQA